MPIFQGFSYRFCTQGWALLCRILVCFTALAACGEAAENDGQQVIGGLRVSQLLGADDNNDDKFQFARQMRDFTFPRDHGAHADFRSEWWYITAVLSDKQGNEYGVQYTLFRRALSAKPTGVGPWQTGQAYLAHLAVTDVANRQHYHAQRFSRGHPALAAVEVSSTAQPRFSAHIEDWSLAGSVAGQLQWQLQAVQHDEFAVQLDLQQTQPLVLQGDQGLSSKGPDAASYYYSLPRLRTQGMLTVAGRQVEVAGWAWLDREWSTSVLGDHLRGWDWFALQLDDGRSLMVFNLRRKDGQRDIYNHGQLMDEQATRRLHSADYDLRPLRYWRDASGSSWPVAWQLTLRQGLTGPATEQFQIEAMLDDQLMDMGLVYWEGIVAVRSNGVDLGRGYMELTGYGG